MVWLMRCSSLPRFGAWVYNQSAPPPTPGLKQPGSRFRRSLSSVGLWLDIEIDEQLAGYYVRGGELDHGVRHRDPGRPVLRAVVAGLVAVASKVGTKHLAGGSRLLEPA